MRAAEMLIRRGIRVNMTLCFSQEQAEAVYAATRGSKQPVYVSPFTGRLDDRGESGIDLVRNIKRMYEGEDAHVFVVAASIRHIDHLLGSFALDAPRGDLMVASVAAQCMLSHRYVSRSFGHSRLRYQFNR